MPIQVWLARMERPLTEQEYGDMMALLPDARRERLEKLPKEKHQEVLCAYLLLRMALWEQRGWRDLPRIGVDELGKPFFPDHPDTHFSLSHTAGAAAAALADTPVGVDIERVRPVSVRADRRRSDGGGLLSELGPAGGTCQAHRQRDRDHDADGSAAEPRRVLLRGGLLSWLRGGRCCRTAGAAAAGAPSDAGPAPLTA